MATLRILITGSRKTGNRHIIHGALSRWTEAALPSEVTFVHGDCPTGADAIADGLLRQWGFADSIERHPAQNHPTQNFGPWPGAGPRRNAYMVGLGAYLCIAFPDRKVEGSMGKGTRGCIELCIQAGIPLRVFPVSD